MTTLYLDIETLPAAWEDEQIDAHAAASVPGNYTKPESIAKWIEEHRIETWLRTALDWRHARICCIGVVVEVGHDVQEHTTIMLDEHGEGKMLRELDVLIEQYTPDLIVGHNVIGFDLPRLHIAAARHAVTSLARRLAEYRGHRHAVVDTMRLAMGVERCRLGDLATALGLEGKSGDGSQVYELWVEGRQDAIAAYCLQDVEVTRAVYRALVGAA
jgi:predicted PolB exonuclease-like 3'-5' exonuclease